MADGLSKTEIVEKIVKKYDVSLEDAETGVQKFLSQMIERGFIEE